MDFSKIARQLNEEPFGSDGEWTGKSVLGGDPIRREKNNNRSTSKNKTGKRGHFFENKVADILNDVGSKVGPTFDAVKNKVHTVVGDGATRKADILDEKGNGYSVKTKMNNDQGMKIQQSSHPGTLYSKLGVWSDDRLDSSNRETQKASLRGNPLLQSMIMMFGNDKVAGKDIANLVGMNNGLTAKQLNTLQNFKKGDKSFMKAKQLKEEFPDQYSALMDHLYQNTFGIINGLVRQKGAIDKREPDQDLRPVDRFVSHITDEGVSGKNLGTDDDPEYDFTGSLAMHDIGNDAVRDAIEKLQWFNDDDRFYLAEKETDVLNDRLLDLYPYDEENIKWTMFPGDNNPMVDKYDRRVPVTPGAFKAMMSSNPEVLERLFPVLLSGRIDDGEFKMDMPKVKEEPKAEPKQEPNPQNKGRGNGFAGFLKQVAKAALGMPSRPQEPERKPPAPDGQPMGMPQKRSYTPADLRQRAQEPSQSVYPSMVPDSSLYRSQSPTPVPAPAPKPAPVEPFKPSPIPNIPKQMDSGNLGRLNDEQRSELEDAMRWIRDGKIDSPEEEKAAKRLVRIYNGEMPLDKYDPDLLNRALKMFYGD